MSLHIKIAVGIKFSNYSLHGLFVIILFTLQTRCIENATVYASSETIPNSSAKLFGIHLNVTKIVNEIQIQRIDKIFRINWAWHFRLNFCYFFIRVNLLFDIRAPPFCWWRACLWVFKKSRRGRECVQCALHWLLFGLSGWQPTRMCIHI